MKSFDHFSEDNNEIQIGDRFVPLRDRRVKNSLKLEPQAMDEPREAPVRSYVDPSVVDKSPKLNLRRDMETKLDKDAEKAALSDEQRISRLISRNSDIYSDIRNDKLLQDRILGNVDFAENFFGSEMFRDHFKDLERFKTRRPEKIDQMRIKPGQEGQRFPSRYNRYSNSVSLTGSSNAEKTTEEPTWFDMHELDDEDKFYDYAKAVSRIMDRSYGDFMGGEDMTTKRGQTGWSNPKFKTHGPKNELPMEEALTQWLSDFSGAEINDLSDEVDFSSPTHFSMANKARGQGVRFEDLTALSQLFENGSVDRDDDGIDDRIEALARYARLVGERRDESGIEDDRSLRDFLKNPFFESEEARAAARESGYSDEVIEKFLKDERIQLFPGGRVLLGDRFGIDNSDYAWDDDSEVIDNMEDYVEEVGNGMPLFSMIADMAFDPESESENKDTAREILAYQLGNAFEDDPTDGIWGNDADASSFGGYGLIDQDLDADEMMKIAETDENFGFEETAQNFIDNINRVRSLGYEEGTFYNEDHEDYNDQELIDTYDMSDALRNNNSFAGALERMQEIINRNHEDYTERLNDEYGDENREDGFDVADLYPDGKVPEIEDIDGSQRKDITDDYTNYSLTINNNPNEFGTHRYESLDDDLKNAGLTRRDLKKSVYIAWNAMTGQQSREKLAQKYKAKTGKDENDPGFEPYARKVIAFNALKNWKQNVLPSLEPGTVLFNTPIGGGAGGNMREVLYSKMGFGEYGNYGQQAVVGKDGRVYPIGPKSDSSLARNQQRRAGERARRRPRNESMGEVMYWWQQNPWFSQDEILDILNAF